jgi:hypothetical protein
LLTLTFTALADPSSESALSGSAQREDAGTSNVDSGIGMPRWRLISAFDARKYDLPG